MRVRRASAGTLAVVLMATLIVIESSAPARAQMPAIELPNGFQEIPDITTGLQGPTAVAWAPDGRRFIAEKAGRVRVIEPNGTVKLLVDLRAKVNASGDRGMLGITTDKNFASNGYLYLLYVYDVAPLTPDSAGAMVSRLTRVTVKQDSTVVNPSDPETVILGTYNSGPCPPANNDVDCIPADARIHTIGTVKSDPVDGTLWLGSGDSTPTSVQEQAYRTYDESSFAGKIIHIDRNGRGLANHPFCPNNTDLDDVCTKIYAKGFRNPFRFTLRSGKGPIVGDVGNGLREEIDLIQPGKSYGWPCYEGDQKMPGYSQTARCAQEYQKEGTANAHVGPNWAYAHEAGASVIAGPTINNETYPQSYQGDVMVADYVQGWIKRLEFDPQGNLLDVHPFATNWWGGVSLDATPDGRLAYVDIGWDAEPFDAAVRSFVYAPDNQPPVPVAQAAPTSGAAPLQVNFTGSSSTDPDGDPLTYRWDFGDGESSTQANPTHTYTTPKTYEAKLTVDDGLGRNPSDTVSITVTGDPPPQATISEPADGSTYVDGETIELQGSASDIPDGTLSGGSLEWQVLLHHGSHLHEIGTFTGTSPSFVTEENHDSDSYYEIRLTATDSVGQTDVAVSTITPQTIPLTLTSSPTGAPISYDSQIAQPGPFTKQAAIGFKASIAANSSFTKNGTVYNFSGWSQGGARQQTYTVPNEATTITAIYQAVSGAPVNASPPTITGAAEKGSTLQATPGTWSGTQPIEYEYQWQRCPVYPNIVGDDAPLAYWRMGESAGTVATDVSGHARDGSFVSGPALGLGGAIVDDANTSVGFVETGDRMTVGDDEATRLNGDFSIEFWAKLNSYVNTYPGFMRKGSSGSSGTGYAVFYNSDLRPNFKRAGIQKKATAAAALSTDSFKHYVVTYDAAADTLKWYVNGALDKSYVSTVLPDNIDASSLQIGRGDHYGNHVMDEVALYNSALPLTRVEAHFDAGRNACSEIIGATSSSYEVGANDVGRRLRVRVTAGNTAGNAIARSTATDPVADDPGEPPVNTSPPSISGTPAVGETLSSAVGNWSGSAPIDYSTTWQRCPTYASTVLEDAPVGYWRLGEAAGTSATDASGSGRGGTYVNGPVRGVAGALTADPNAATGFVESGDRVEVADDTALRMNGSFSIEFWAKLNSFPGGYPGFVRKGPSSSAATGYLVFYNTDLRPNLKRAGIQKKVSANGALSTQAFKHYVVSYNESTQQLRWYVNGVLDTSFSNVVFPDSADLSALNLGRGDQYGNHVLDEVAMYGSSLSAGRVAAHFAAGGLACSDIPDATESNYVATASDLGARLRVSVTASNAAGISTAVSTPTAPISEPEAPSVESLPTISGTAETGERLVAHRGTWRGTPPVSYDYAWKRCRYSRIERRVVCSGIASADGKRYEARKRDIGYRLKVKVIASNDVGTRGASSPSTTKVKG